MSDYGETDVEIHVEDEDVVPEVTHTWLHLDEIDSYEPSDGETPHIYIFAHEREDRRDELQAEADALKQEYVFAHMIVWPDTLDGIVQGCSDEVMEHLEWQYAVAPHRDDFDADDLAAEARRLKSEVDER